MKLNRKTETSPLHSAFVSDIDECKLKKHNCHRNALCTNKHGSFDCACKGGYTGNGVQCQGKQILMGNFCSPKMASFKRAGSRNRKQTC